MSPLSKLTILGLATCLFSQGRAWRVDTWEGQQCTSAELSSSTFSDDLENARCYSIPTNAESATVVRQDGDSMNNNIEFYVNGKCDSSNYAASIDEGCVDFELTGATNFMLQSDQSDPGRKLRIKGRDVPALVKKSAKKSAVDQAAHPWWVSIQEAAREELGITAEQAVGSLSPLWDPNLPADLGYGHGDVNERFGKIWKWQQVALGMTIGIPIEEWDDNVHAKSDEFIIYGDEEYDKLQKRSDENGLDITPNMQYVELSKRWNYGQCKAVIDCGRRITDATAATIGSGWAQAVRGAYKVKDAYETFTDFSGRHPWFVTLGGNAISYGLGYAHGTYSASSNKALGNCSGDSTQVQSWIQALVDVAAAGKDNAAQTIIQLPSGDTVKISAEVVPKAQYQKDNVQCDADGKTA